MKHFASSALLAALCWGCVLPTIHPLFNEGDVVFDPALLGTWTAAGDDTTWTFAEGTGRAYRVTVADGDDRGEFVGHLAKIGRHRFLDIVPDAGDAVAKSMAGEFLLPLHLFARVDAIGDTVEIAVIDVAWVKKHLKAQPDALAHTRFRDGILVTAETPALRAFVLAQADNPDAFQKLPPYRQVGVSGERRSRVPDDAP